MAVVRRHWLQVVAGIVSLACIGALVTLPMALNSPPEADASPGQLTEDQLLERWEVYEAKASRLERLRGDLGLTNRDLAAMGLSEAQAQSVLQALLDWSEGNQARVDAARSAERVAQAQLREATRKVRVGPRDESVIRSLPRLRDQVEQKRRARTALQAEAAALVEARLDGAQRGRWLTIRGQRHAPGELRYVPGLDAAALSGTERATLPLGQRRAIDQARSRIRTNLPGVLDAEEAVLPMPPAIETSRTDDAPTDAP